MPTSKPRITLTLEPHTYEVLSRLSASTDQSMASLVTDLVQTTLPAMERMVVLLERVASASEEVRSGLTTAIERAERDVMPVLLEALGQGEMFLDRMEEEVRDKASSRTAPPGAVPLSRRIKAQDPRPVTRG